MNSKQKGEQVITTIEKTSELLIKIPGIKSQKKRKRFVKEVLKKYKQNEKIHRLLVSMQHLILDELKNDFVLRLATPRELGAKSDILLSFWLDDLAEKNGLILCSPVDAIRVSFYLPNSIDQFRETYSKQNVVWCSTWHVHMNIIEFKMSGDMFVSGLGCPDPVFEIWPDGDKPLNVKWVYMGRRSLPLLDWPVLFRKP